MLHNGSRWPALDGVLAGLHLQATGPADGDGVVALRGGPGLDVAAAVTALRASGRVAFAEPDYVVRADLVPNDTRYPDQEWWLTAMQAQSAWDITTGDPNLIVAIVDTGVANNHPEFAGRVLPGYNFVANNDNAYDDNGHGTHVAGIASAQGNNGQGIAGLSWQSKILPVKVLSAAGPGRHLRLRPGHPLGRRPRRARHQHQRGRRLLDADRARRDHLRAR